MEKVGVYPGSFDPPHLGHLAVVRKALREGIDKVIVVPAPKNPWKTKIPLDYHDRVSLCSLGFAEENVLVMTGTGPYLDTSKIEDQDGVVYTWRQLEKIIEELGEDNEYYLICGTDVASSIEKWNNWEWIKERFKILNIGRPGYDEENHEELLEISSSVIRENPEKYKSYLHPEVYSRIKKCSYYL